MSLDEEWEQPGSVDERPDARTLRGLAGGKRLEPRRALMIIRQVLDALTAVHDGGGLHGDISPDHILILPGLGDDRIKLTETTTGAKRSGDPVYSAPESALGSIDGRADIYSTGAVLFELLTGHAPFFADDQHELRRLHAYAPIQTLKQRVPDLAFADLLEPIVAAALEKNRDARYQTAKDMIAAIDPVLDAIEAAAVKAPSAPSDDKLNESILLLAQHLMPAPPARDEPIIPVNVTRQVRVLPWPTRAYRTLRRQLDRLTSKQRRILGATAAVLGVVLVVATVTCSGRKTTPPASARSSSVYLDRGRTALARGDEQRALTLYEQALRITPTLANDPKVIDDVGRLSSSKDADVRNQAYALADRHGFGKKLDRIAGQILDLEQATTCDEQRTAIGELAGSADRRALPVLQKAKLHKCVERDATAAIERITKASKLR